MQSVRGEQFGFSANIKAFFDKLPVSRTTLIKLLIVLAYTQLLISQMDNRKNLEIEVKRLTNVHSSSQPTNYWFSSADRDQQQGADAATCCGGGGSGSGGGNREQEDGHLSSWFNCMWTSAKACSGSNSGEISKRLAGSDDGYTRNRATRFMEYLYYLAKEIFNYQTKLSRLILDKLRNMVLIIPSIWHAWITRWRSPIIQRLCQSMLVHFIYITSLLLAGDENLEDE